MKKNKEDIDKEKSGKLELSDEALEAVVGGIDRLGRRKALITSEFSDFLCACAVCDNDTSWVPYDDGRTVFCNTCGAEKDRAWYENNKIRKKGISKII